MIIKKSTSPIGGFIDAKGNSYSRLWPKTHNYIPREDGTYEKEINTGEYSLKWIEMVFTCIQEENNIRLSEWNTPKWRGLWKSGQDVKLNK